MRERKSLIPLGIPASQTCPRSSAEEQQASNLHAGVQLPPRASQIAEDVFLELLWRERHAPDGEHAHCPKCDQTRTFKRYETTQQRQAWTCTGCGHHIHPTAGTIFHKSSRPLREWFLVIDMVAGQVKPNAKDVERAIGCNYKTARRMRASAASFLANDAGPWWPTFCACGCGELLNPQVLRFRALARRGLTPGAIGRIVGAAPGYVRRTLRNPPHTIGQHWWLTPKGDETRVVRANTQNPWNALQAAQGAKRRNERIAEKERKRAARAAKWWNDRPEHQLPRSLDAAIAGDEGDSFYAITASTQAAASNPADVIEREAASARLWEIVGDMDPNDVARMTEWDLRRLREKLAEAGLTPRGVSESERERLRTPERHSGAAVARAHGHSRKSRADKIAHKEANRQRGNSNRPAQKPHKRWDREALAEW